MEQKLDGHMSYQVFYELVELHYEPLPEKTLSHSPTIEAMVRIKFKIPTHRV